jgi:alcohol dehydrogenase (NADP+)
VAFTTSEGKRADALSLGADDVVNSRDPDEMAAHRSSLDLVLNSIAVKHDLDPYLEQLRLDGTMVLVGIPAEAHPAPSVATLVGKRRSVAGSLVGGIAETQELLDFSAERHVLAEIETIAMAQLEEAFARMQRSDVKYRFVIDTSRSR